MTLDALDQYILQQRIYKREAYSGPRVGDWAIMPDGEEKRFTHDHGAHGLQTTWAGGSQSFYLSDGGHLDYSGGLDPCITPERIEATEETKDAPAWFFHHNERRAHNGVNVMVPCRVYRVREAMQATDSHRIG